MLGIVIVNYHNDAQTEQFVREELSRLRTPFRAVVVNNGAGKEESASLAERCGIDVIPHANDGFAVGNNAGAAYLCGRFDIDNLLFTNTDIRLGSDEVVEVLLRKLSEVPEAGCIGPEIVGLDGERQSPEPYQGMWDRYVWMYLSTPFMSLERKVRRFRLDYPKKAEEGFHYKLMGSFLLCSRKDFEAAGGFDEATFLYGEEPILSERMARIGKKCYFLPSVRVIHEHGATIRSVLSRKAMSLRQFDSEAYYYQTYRHYSKGSVFLCRMAYRCILWLTIRLNT